MENAREHGEAQEPRYVSVKDLAELLNLSRLSVYRRIHARVLPGRIAGRKIDVYGPFYRALKAEIDACRPVDIDEFAAAWTSGHEAGGASAGAVA